MRFFDKTLLILSFCWLCGSALLATDVDELGGWESEALSSEVDSVLKEVASLLAGSEWKQSESWEAVLHEEFSGAALLPVTIEVVIEDDRFKVSRGRVEDAEFTLESDLVKALSAVFDRIDILDAKIAAKFKLFGIEPDADGKGAVTRQWLSLKADGSEQSQEQNAVWEMTWRKEGASSSPQLLSARVLSFEEVRFTGREGAPLLFSDLTESVMEGVAAFEDQLKLGTNYWLERMENRFPLYYYGNQGIALGDIDNDGLDDVYVCQPGGLPNRLFHHQSDGSVEDVTAEAGLDFLDYTRSALVLDLDNDGDQDLALATLDGLLLLENNGSGKFSTRKIIPAGRGALSMSAADFDQDGLVDLYLCKYFADRSQEGEFALPLPYHDANNGGGNLLLRNVGGFEFSDETDSSGLGDNNYRFSFAASWEDFDNDGDQDLYVANDFGRNSLYRNDAGRFSDVAAELGVEDLSAGMSVTWGDVNQDGWMDLYVSNMFSAAGNRIAYQRQFQSELESGTREAFQRHARGNSLFLNQRGERFIDASIDSGTTLGRWAWSSLIADLNADGKEDILVANGYITGRRLDDL
ncbi:MAG: VCBS repeat-containing protein [Verrucomicrobiota bacterium]